MSRSSKCPVGEHVGSTGFAHTNSTRVCTVQVSKSAFSSPVLLSCFPASFRAFLISPWGTYITHTLPQSSPHVSTHSPTDHCTRPPLTTPHMLPHPDCWSMPYMINVVVAALSLLVFVTLTALFQVGGSWVEAEAAFLLLVVVTRTTLFQFFL